MILVERTSNERREGARDDRVERSMSNVRGPVPPQDAPPSELLEFARELARGRSGSSKDEHQKFRSRSPTERPRSTKRTDDLNDSRQSKPEPGWNNVDSDDS